MSVHSVFAAVNYTDVRNAIIAQNPIVPISASPIVWQAPGLLTINYNAALFTNGGEPISVIVFEGGNTFPLFAVNNAGGADWGQLTGAFQEATFTFQNGRSLGNGGAISVSNGGSVFLNNGGVFSNNRAANGGAIYLQDATVVLNAVNGFLFTGNTASGIPQDIYLGGATPGNVTNLILATNAGKGILMQGGVASADNTPVISKNGPGIWQIEGNSSGYRGTTNINGGAFLLQPGAVYGATGIGAGTVTIGPGGILAFNVGTGNVPLLQGATVTINGNVAVIGAPTGPLEQIAVSATNPIAIAGIVPRSGLAPFYGTIGPYEWQLYYPPGVTNQLELAITNINVLPPEEGDLIDELLLKPGLLSQYALGILRSENPEYLTGALQGEIVTGPYVLLWNQLTLLSIQVEDRLNTPEEQTERISVKGRDRILLASKDKAFPLTYRTHAPWVGWGEVFGWLGRQNVVNGSNAYDSRTAGVTAGFDRALDPNWRLGGALSLQRGILDWDLYNGQSSVNTLAALVYGSYDQDSWFARSQLGGGGSWAKNRRDIPFMEIGLPNVTASSNPSLPFINARVSSGYHFYSHKNLRFTPSVGLFYVHTISDPYNESGADDFNLRVTRANQDNLEAQINFELAYRVKINERPVMLRANYGIGYESLDKQVTITTGFLAFPDLNTFNASAVSPSRFRQFAEVGMNVDVAKNVQLRFDYIGIFARHQYINTGAVGVKVVF